MNVFFSFICMAQCESHPDFSELWIVFFLATYKSLGWYFYRNDLLDYVAFMWPHSSCSFLLFWRKKKHPLLSLNHCTTASRSPSIASMLPGVATSHIPPRYHRRHISLAPPHHAMAKLSPSFSYRLSCLPRSRPPALLPFTAWPTSFSPWQPLAPLPRQRASAPAYLAS